eukprot:763421-Hanusia_phi.AAC.7
MDRLLPDTHHPPSLHVPKYPLLVVKFRLARAGRHESCADGGRRRQGRRRRMEGSRVRSGEESIMETGSPRTPMARMSVDLSNNSTSMSTSQGLPPFSRLEICQKITALHQDILSPKTPKSDRTHYRPRSCSTSKKVLEFKSQFRPQTVVHSPRKPKQPVKDSQLQDESDVELQMSMETNRFIDDLSASLSDMPLEQSQFRRRGNETRSPSILRPDSPVTQEAMARLGIVSSEIEPLDYERILRDTKYNEKIARIRYQFLEKSREGLLHDIKEERERLSLLRNIIVGIKDRELRGVFNRFAAGSGAPQSMSLRERTMDFNEWCACLKDLGILPDKVSIDMARDVFSAHANQGRGEQVGNAIEFLKFRSCMKEVVEHIKREETMKKRSTIGYGKSIKEELDKKQSEIEHLKGIEQRRLAREFAIEVNTRDKIAELSEKLAFADHVVKKRIIEFRQSQRMKRIAEKERFEERVMQNVRRKEEQEEAQRRYQRNKKERDEVQRVLREKLLEEKKIVKVELLHLKSAHLRSRQ